MSHNDGRTVLLRRESRLEQDRRRREAKRARQAEAAKQAAQAGEAEADSQQAAQCRRRSLLSGFAISRKVEQP